MPYYEKSLAGLLPLMADDLLKAEGDEITYADAVDWFSVHYPDFKESTIRAHLYRFSVNSPSRHHYGAKTDGSEDLLVMSGQGRFRRYDPATEDEEGVGDEGEIEESDGQFAYEHNLRDYLARNMDLIERGLELVGIEQDAGGRRIDILGRDTNGCYVVVELKVSRGYDRVVGQLLRYQNWVRRNLSDGRPVRGVIIASEITPDLRLACESLSDVRLLEYSLAVELKDVTKEAA